MSLERSQIVDTLNRTKNVTKAAHALGASRRTLQNRMRFYSLPPGKAGRPRELLPYKRALPSLGAFALLGVAGLGLYWVFRKLGSAPSPAPSTTVSGLDYWGV